MFYVKQYKTIKSGLYVIMGICALKVERHGSYDPSLAELVWCKIHV